VTPSEIQLLSQAIAFHPLAVVGGLTVLIYISRRNYYSNKSKKEALSSR